MSLVSKEDLNELDMEFVLERESIPFRVSRGVSGYQLNIKTCPLCGDTRWRTYFGVDSGAGNCFVCGEGFSKVKAVAGLYGTEGRETWEKIAELLREQGWRPKRAAVVATDPGDVVLPVSIELPTELGENLVYLEKRGFGGEICRYFGLRYCEFGWWKFKDAEGHPQTQNFANRVIIPVHDLDGKLVTFQGRDVTGTSERKYLFPIELPGTGKYLLNGHNVVATKEVVMGEGIFDIAAIKLAFDEDQALRDIVPIGSFGKHLSYGDPGGNDQLGRFLQLKKRGVETVTIMWDGEAAALTAARSCARPITPPRSGRRLSISSGGCAIPTSDRASRAAPLCAPMT